MIYIGNVTMRVFGSHICAPIQYGPYMTQGEAKPLILAEMRKRLTKAPYSGSDAGFARYLMLKQERPELFEFRCSGDQWQLVHRWMLEAGLVTQ